MIVKELIKEFLVEEIKDENIDFESLSQDFQEYIEIDFYDWLKGNYKYFIEGLELANYKKNDSENITT